MDLFDVFGILFIFMTVLISLAAALYFFVYFSHPEEKDFAGLWLTRGLIVFSMGLVVFMVFLVPLDMIANFTELAY